MAGPEQTKTQLLIPAAFPCSMRQFEDFDVLGPEALTQENANLEHVRAVAAAGHRKIGKDIISRLPNLEIIAKFGVGYDTIDVDAATDAGVIVTNTPDVLTEEVADLTLGLLIATVRQIPQAERYLRAGNWTSKAFPLSPSLRGRKVGVAGLGRIGAAIARRVAAMGLDIAYYGRNQQADIAWDYHDNITDLARAVDVLILSVPGGADTVHLVDADVLAALGPNGIIINVARGSVIDEAALITALQNNTILAAGLDVFDHEPAVPQAFLDLDNVVLLPHIGSASITTRESMGDLVFANLKSWFAGKGPITPVN
ncbi:MAG: 2-hydroxyacid dehydrogenase [Rhizobiales bacterium]|nr:2-hydroxyacid dehydrogenase [Hyphomicrobiales bacterium]